MRSECRNPGYLVIDVLFGLHDLEEAELSRGRAGDTKDVGSEVPKVPKLFTFCLMIDSQQWAIRLPMESI